MTVKDDDQNRLSTNTEVSKVGSWSFDFGKRLFFATNETYLIFGRRSDEFDGSLHQIVAEKIVLGGLTHSDVGAWLCKKWQFRDDIICDSRASGATGLPTNSQIFST
jgi:hypothetical protein